MFNVQILWATYINATDNVINETVLKVKMAKFKKMIMIKGDRYKVLTLNFRSVSKPAYFMEMKPSVNFYRPHKFHAIH